MLADGYKDYMYGFIKRVLDRVGPRESCSESEIKTARLLADELQPVCDKVEIEKFTCSPTAFLGFLPFAVALYALAEIFYWFLPPVSFLFAAVGFSMLLLEFMLYVEYVDFLFPKKESENVIGTITPKGPVTKRVIISGHLDSAYEFNLWLFLKNAAIPVMIIGVLAVLLLFCGSFAKTLAWFHGNDDAAVFRVIGIICGVLYPIVGSFMFFHTYTPVPGAMDDLAGVSIAAGLGKYLADAKREGGFIPQNTEVLLYGAACEEAGLRGAKRYAAAHINEFKAIPTYAICFDGIYDEKYLSVMKREICTGAKHDPYLVKLAQDMAAAQGRSIITTIIPLGASDASAFTRAGISSTCIVCQDTSKLVPNYHTRFDTIEKIRPESLAVSLQLAIDMLKKIDES